MKVAIIAVLLSMVSGVPAFAATFVYVSNAEDGDIGMYTLQSDGSLRSGPRFKAEKVVMPMAVSPDKRFLIAAVRSKPYQAFSYSIDPGSGALKLVGTGPLAESFPYISLDRGGRFLLGASYGANLVSDRHHPGNARRLSPGRSRGNRQSDEATTGCLLEVARAFGPEGHASRAFRHDQADER